METEESHSTSVTPENKNHGDSGPVNKEDHSGAGSNRKLSGCQKRKLLKQQAIAEGREPPKFGLRRKQNQTLKRQARTAANASGEALQNRTEEQRSKRQASSSLDVPEKQDRLKRSKTEGSYASVASHLPRVVLTWGDYMGGQMPEDVCTLLKEAVVSKVLSIPDGDFVPKFPDSFPRKGTVVFVCEDNETKTWLENVAEDLDLGQELKVRVVKPEELKVTKVMVRLPTGVKTAEDFFKLVRRQNGGVDTSKWATLKQTPEGCLILGLDEPSVATLKSRGYKLLAGVSKATFKLLGRNTAGQGTQALGEN